MTRAGLKNLGRPLRRIEGGTQYLRTIAAEGGIPVKLLSGQGGYRSALVGLVADLARMGLGCPRDVALAFAARRSRRLPIGYRTEEFRNLFVDFAMEILELRTLAPEGLAVHEVEPWLDRVNPDWREGLPLRLDGDAARSLLSEAVSVTRRSGLVTDPFCRVLLRDAEECWTSWIDVEEQAEIAPELIAGVEHGRHRLRLGPVGPLASAVPDLLLALDRDGGSDIWTCRRISARRTSRFPFPLEQDAELIAMADGAFLTRVRLAGGDAIDIGVSPTFWRVAETGATGAEALSYAGSASLKTQDPHIWLLCAKDLTPDVAEGITAKPDGEIAGGQLWRLSGSGRVLLRGWNAAIATRADADDREEIQVVGPLEYRLLDRTGTPVYRGLPTILHRRAGRGFRKLSHREMFHRFGRSKPWRLGLPRGDMIGRVEIAVKEGEGVGARVTVNVAPPGISIRDVDPGNPEIRLLRLDGLPMGWKLRIADGETVAVNDKGLAEAAVSSVDTLRGRLSIALVSPKGDAPLAWTLDLPRARGEFQDQEGEVLARDRDITMLELRNWRVVPAETGKTELRIRLEGARSGVSPVIVRPIVTEQPLSAFRPLLEEMLVAGGPDSELRLRILSGGLQSPRLKLRHVLGETCLEGCKLLTRRQQTLVFDADVQAVAIDMEHPDRVETANIEDLAELGEGRWFLLPNWRGVPMSPPRPYVTPQPSALIGADAPSRDARIAHFAARYRSREADTELSRLSKLDGQLLAHGVSPGALDQVHALCDVPEAAVRLLMRVSESDLDDMLSLELHGGPRWIFVGPEHWAEGFRQQVATLREVFSASPSLVHKADEEIRRAIASRTADIVRLRPALTGHVVLGLPENDPFLIVELAKRLGELPSALQDPEAALRDYADEVVRRNATTAPRLYDLDARNRPRDLAKYDPDLRGLIDAPLFVAEVAFGTRPPPTTRQSIELLQAIHTDTGAFEAALPAAMAWLNDRLQS
ncbi:MAG: hypothetical protein GJ678_13145 [Rhodobacteraceae bacterium]|nr:hypothetical protein [Paracoccaceae bacterium]